MGQTEHDDFIGFDDTDAGRDVRRKRDRRLASLHFWSDPDEPSEAECDMCGKPNGATLRPDGQRMCSSCWTIWNG